MNNICVISSGLVITPRPPSPLLQTLNPVTSCHLLSIHLPGQPQARRSQLACAQLANRPRLSQLGARTPQTPGARPGTCEVGGGGIHLCHTSLHLPLRTDVLWKTPGHTHKPLLVADLEQVGEDRAAGFVKGRVEVTRALRAGEVPPTQRRQETGISETSLLSAGKHHNHPQESCLLAGLAPRKEGLRPQEEGRGSAGQGRP